MTTKGKRREPELMARQEDLDAKTTRRRPPRAPFDKAAFVTVLTVLSHPDPRRVGERAALPEVDLRRSAELCRGSPRFAPPGSSWDDRPLEDLYLNRKSCELVPTKDGLDLVRKASTIEVALDGVPIDDAASIPHSALELGVTLELASRIALLLHCLPQAAFEAGEVSPSASEIVGASTEILRVRGAIDRVADLDETVLLRGESGTGKELVARALHRQSHRASKPFIAVDLGALSPALAASELFGHAKGAFTGANTAREGFFRAADGGTLFLDEVGEAPLEVQAMLLRVLETRRVLPIGSHTPIPVDVRLVAATDADLETRARRGDFKAPLIHRLAAYVIELPPLRERRDDFGRLLVHLARPVLRKLGEEQRLDHPAEDEQPPWLPADLVARLARAPWEGNVRQLANVVRQMVIDSRGQPELCAGPLVRSLLAPAAVAPLPSTPSQERSVGPQNQETRSGQFFRRPSDLGDDEVEEALRACNFDLTATARHLGVRRPSVYNLVRRHPSLRLAEDVSEDELRRVLEEHAGDVAASARRLEVSQRALSRRVTQLCLGGDAH